MSACTQYATNAKYVEVNSGRHPKIRVYPGMHALSPDEVDVYTSLVEKCQSAQVTVMHNHCMSEQVFYSVLFHGLSKPISFSAFLRAENILVGIGPT